VSVDMMAGIAVVIALAIIIGICLSPAIENE